MRKMLRQGDVLLRPIAKIRGEPMKPKGGRHVVASGEQTGHHHVVPASTVAAFMDRDGMCVSGHGPLSHEEHNSLNLDGEGYEVVLQRRASPTDHRPVRAAD